MTFRNLSKEELNFFRNLSIEGLRTFRNLSIEGLTTEEHLQRGSEVFQEPLFRGADDFQKSLLREGLSFNILIFGRNGQKGGIGMLTASCDPEIFKEKHKNTPGGQRTMPVVRGD